MNFILSKKSIIILAFCLFIFLSFSNLVLAVNLKDAFIGDTEESFIDTAAGEAGYDISQAQAEDIVSTIIQAALSFIGVIFLILMIYGGYSWMTAGGNEEQVAKAKNTITAAIIGLIIVLSAYAISYFVIEKLGEKTLEETQQQE